MSELNVAIIGTGIFATNAHLPALTKSKYFNPCACYNRTKSKAESFAATSSTITTVYDNLEDAFEDPKIDLIDALLPVQFNLDAVKLAVKHKKNISLEKPIAATLAQAKEIVNISRNNPDITIFIAEHWCYYKSIPLLKEAMSKIGNVYSFTYHSTGQFNFDNKYLATAWRKKPEHVGGFLSDGGVHQLALLTGVVGEIKTISARTKQIREASGVDDIAYSLAETKSGLIGTFTYGSAFGSTDKKCFFEIMGDNGSIHFDFSPGKKETISLKIGGGSPESASSSEEIEIENENRSVDTEFEILGEALHSGNFSKVISTPEVAFHHLAIVDAMVKSSADGGKPYPVETI
ncbi:hypothetical protein CANARDRAFT_27261 [[Candida] arabinofermentans NRRL YB-2248]|uniref:Gfo/Idh/MocA-like oxidoreductase N-terminal domain-containing protein n=1 Tax=[Candida] arabinofermentans NRRL YB-2248 TaxID=983967 RepID=A0A1E4T552_9ASCO|nr:hypothetical protein CANARDRAFT_27261 [[Candida] arabinofermentans NRRL YB-2248]